MIVTCNGMADFFERRKSLGESGAAEWREHLDSCPSCREQEAADQALRMAFTSPPPKLEDGFELRLRERLHERETSSARGRVRGFMETARWLLGAYGIATTLVSLLILSRVPWQTSLPQAPATVLGIALAAAVLLGPIILLDSRGVILPPRG